MTRFKSQHQRSDTKTSSSLIRVLLYAAALVGSVYLFAQRSSSSADSASTSSDLATDGTVYDYGLYQLKYNEDREQPDWVRYTLTRDQLRQKRLPRPRNFYRDPRIASGSADLSDYKNSGYTRGHMVPQADMSYDAEAQRSTFLMSNISPQTRACNGGIWRELEENTRDWAYKFGSIHVMSGPIWSGGEEEIGKNRVDVPRFYFKAILDVRKPEKKGIGFIIPNEISYKHLNKYMVSIDEIELRTGLDLFNQIPDSERDVLEQSYDPAVWPISDKRFELRKNQWNKN